METQLIDWTAQWESFSPNFYDGLCHLDLTPFGKKQTLLLKPGGGFGDFSHPTTRLSLRLLSKELPCSTLIDIGCGSGILSLSGLLLGVKNGIAIDIDPDALTHTLQNAELNHLTSHIKIASQLTLPAPDNPLVVMNMIFSEQKIAWSAQVPLHLLSHRLITSGIMTVQRDHYLKWTDSLGWKLITEVEEEGWLAFLFER